MTDVVGQIWKWVDAGVDIGEIIDLAQMIKDEIENREEAEASATAELEEEDDQWFAQEYGKPDDVD